MRQTTTTTLILAGTAAVMACAAGVAYAQKGKGNQPVPDAVATVTFDDGPGDLLTSDGGGSYTGATIYSSSGDLRLPLGVRTLTVALTNPVDSAPGHDVPDGNYSFDYVLMVRGLGKVTGAGWHRASGRLAYGPQDSHILAFKDRSDDNVLVNGTEFCVLRHSPTEWQVASSDACSEEGGQAGLFEEGVRKVPDTYKAAYLVPFRATVVCTKNCPP